MNNKPAPRPHAELIKAWADGAKIQSRYLIDFDNVEQWSKWTDDNEPDWCDEDYQFRIKPEDNNKPWKPKDGERYYYFDQFFKIYNSVFVKGNVMDQDRIAAGNYFRSHEAALKGITSIHNNAGGEQYRELEHRYENVYYEFVAAKKEIDELIANPVLDGKPITNGEKALIQALREVKVQSVFAEDSILSYIDDNGKLDSTGGVIAFDVSILTMKYNEQIREALKQIKHEQEAQNEAK